MVRPTKRPPIHTYICLTGLGTLIHTNTLSDTGAKMLREHEQICVHIQKSGGRVTGPGKHGTHEDTLHHQSSSVVYTFYINGQEAGGVGSSDPHCAMQAATNGPNLQQHTPSLAAGIFQSC